MTSGSVSHQPSRSPFQVARRENSKLRTGLPYWAMVLLGALAGWVAECSGQNAAFAGPPPRGRTPAATLAISVSGNRLLDGNGNPLLLHGVNASGLEFVAIDGYDPSDPWGGQEPEWPAVLRWKANVVRLPLNEASWLGLTTIDTSATIRDADPGADYRQTVADTVAAANAAGLYVILDLHWGAPSTSSPMMQSQMADADNSLNFWTSIANTFKANPSVLFELYNEPYFYGLTGSENQWTVLMNGGTLSYYPAESGTYNYQNVFPVLLSGASGAFIAGETVTEGAASAVVNHWEPSSNRIFIQAASGSILENSPFSNAGTIKGSSSGATATVSNASLGWNVASMQVMINAVRATGATNIVLIAGVGYNDDLSHWLANRPTDPLNELACTWHPYPPEQFVAGASVASAGAGYAVNDSITLPQPNTVYEPAQFIVTSVGGGGALTGIRISQGGSYLQTHLPKDPVHQAETSGQGHGASFDLSFENLAGTWSMPANWPAVLAIAAELPVVITETGEHDTPGTKGSPFLHQLLPWADSNGISYLGWTWNVWQSPDDVLIQNANGTPTDGYGQYFHSHLLKLAQP
ncbi:MAG: cellulase family glycosylhydrolase [Terriglobales bacterium]|jgi:hypothetical protein